MIKKTQRRFAFIYLLAFLAIYTTPVRSASIPSEILSPVVGDLEAVSSLEQCSNTKWCFNQHQSGGHAPGGGICQADDTYAWDVNLNTPTFDSDKGKPVYAVAEGVVSQTYGGCINAGGSYRQLLIEHNFQGNTWWSGYLHLRDIQVTPEQSVDKHTLLGYISNTSPEPIPNHLHFVVYKGQNAPGGLVSFDANIVPIVGQAIPVISTPLKISPSPPYHTGDRINAEFTISNKATAPITFSILTVGGRDPDDRVADFTFMRDITLNPNKSFNYEGSLTLARAGNYHFFCAYQTPDGKWNPSIDLGAGLTDEDRIEDIVVGLNNVALGKPCTIITNGAEDYSDGHPGEWPRDITDGRLAYQPVSLGKEDGCIAWQNEDHEELLVVTVTIDLGATHNITKIRYNPGNCERAETWNADIMESPFGKTPTNPGSPYRGTWTEQTGSITTSKVTIKLEKTRRSWATDWLFIGEIEVWGTSIE